MSTHVLYGYVNNVNLHGVVKSAVLSHSFMLLCLHVTVRDVYATCQPNSTIIWHSPYKSISVWKKSIPVCSDINPLHKGVTLSFSRDL